MKNQVQTAPTPQTRPQHALLMAAGGGSRMGGQAKGLLSLHGTPLLQRQLHMLQAAGLQATVVLGHQQAQAARLLADHMRPRLDRLLVCPDWSSGLSTSVLLGIQHLPPEQDALVVLVDMPWIGVQHLHVIQQRWGERPASTQALVPCYRSQRGHPVVIGAQWLDLCRARGVAPRQLMNEHPKQVWFCPVDDPAFVMDVDTPADWQACLQAFDPKNPAKPTSEGLSHALV